MAPKISSNAASEISSNAASEISTNAASDLRLDLDMGIYEVRLPRQEEGRRLPACGQEAISGMVNKAASDLRLDLDMGIYEVRLPRSAVMRFPGSEERRFRTYDEVTGGRAAPALLA